MRQPSRLTQTLCVFFGLTVSFSAMATQKPHGHKQAAVASFAPPVTASVPGYTVMSDAMADKMLVKASESGGLYTRYGLLAQDLPGVRVTSQWQAGGKHGRGHSIYVTQVKRFDAMWRAQTGGNDAKIGRYPISAEVAMNSLFGGDRLSVSGNTTEQLGPTWSVGTEYQKVLTVDGLRLRLNYLHNAYDQPYAEGQSYLYETKGKGYAVSLQQPLIVTYSRRLDVYAGVSYAEGDPVSRTQDLNRYPTDIHAHAQEPVLMLGAVYTAGNRFGQFMGDVKLTKGMDLFGLTPAYSATGRPEPVQVNPDPDMHFMKLNTVLRQQIPLRREWQLKLKYRFQLSNRTLPIPMSQKIGFSEGGYASQGFSGDVGQEGHVGLVYQPTLLARRFIPVSFELYYAAARIRNYSGELSYAAATPQTVGLRTSFSIPQAYIHGFIDIGKPLEATSVSRSKATRVIFGIGQTF